jgi:hypothetical protein
VREHGAHQVVNPGYMSDYDTTAADTLGRLSGLLGAYGDTTGGNPDVKLSGRFGAGNDEGGSDDRSAARGN